MTGVNPPGADDPTLEPPPVTEQEAAERRERITLAELIAWYRARDIPLDVDLHPWRPDVEGAPDAFDG